MRARGGASRATFSPGQRVSPAMEESCPPGTVAISIEKFAPALNARTVHIP